MERVQSDDVAVTERAAAEFIAARLTQAARERGLATLAISGGSTPWGMLSRLAALRLPWNSVHILQVDERIVPLDDAARNWQRFLANPLARRIPDANRHAMPVEIEDPELAAGRYADTLVERAGDPPELDVVHLGIGEDGHTASLFAGDPLLEEKQRWVGVSGRHQEHRRLSLTLPALNRAQCVVWFAVGPTRRDAVRRLLAGDLTIPASHVERDRAICFTDADATPAM
ncbi:MAG: 6-phosphogluconolactonase [Steroidobacteraceae bacterium]